MEGEASPPPFGICTVNVGKHPVTGKDLPLQTVQASKQEDGSLRWELPYNEPNLAFAKMMEANDPRFSHTHSGAIVIAPLPVVVPPKLDEKPVDSEPDLIEEKPKPKK